jgi:lantibiotic biosynthesis protein
MILSNILVVVPSDFAWRPLLDGEPARRAAATIDVIVADLCAHRAPPERAADVLRGDAGSAVLFAYLERAHPGRGHRARALEWLDRVSDGVGALSDTPGLFGFPGAGWAVEHATRLLGNYDPEVNDAIDEALLELLRARPEWLGFEWSSGVGGWATYALERLPLPAAREILTLIVDFLDGAGERRGDEIRWPAPPWTPLAADKQRFPDGCHPLDPAHGAVAVVALLTACCAHGIAEATARPLLDGTARFLAGQRRPDARFANFAGEAPRGFGWCHGNPGVTAVLAAAGRFDRECARRAAQDSTTFSVDDPTLCHGTAGLAHQLNRLHHASGDETLAAAARLFYEQTMALGRPGEGVGGFRHFIDGEWVGWPGLLYGASGIALALLAAITDVEPAWDRLLLLSGWPPP